jgi:hypothetical protein
MTAAVNTPDFNLEDAYAGLLATAGDNLVGAPILVSMVITDLATTHIAVIVEKLQRSEDMPRSGNWQCDVHVKVVTAIDDTPQAPFPSLRALHKQRAGVVRDIVMVGGLDALLEAQAQSLDESLTVQGYDFSDILHRIEGRSWVTEFVVHHAIVNANPAAE